MTSRFTTVLQYVQKNIGKTLENMGYEVVLSVEENSMESLHVYTHFKILSQFNPHAIISINHMNNDFLHKDIFNFVWFQDPMPVLTSPDSPIHLRKRDFIYSLLPFLDDFLERKELPFRRQSFCINPTSFKINNRIKRIKNKIVFIGSSYYEQIPESLLGSEMLNELTAIYLDGGKFSKQRMTEFSNKYKINLAFINTNVIPYIVRDISVIEMCKTLSTKFTIEIYGWGWERHKEVIPYFKGSLSYGKELSEVYHSAEYALAPHGNGIMQQRVLEAAACGCVSMVYDCRYIDKKSPSFEGEIILFRKISEIESLINQKTNYKLNELVKKHSFKNFGKSILKTIKKNMKEV